MSRLDDTNHPSSSILPFFHSTVLPSNPTPTPHPELPIYHQLDTRSPPSHTSPSPIAHPLPITYQPITHHPPTTHLQSHPIPPAITSSDAFTAGSSHTPINPINPINPTHPINLKRISKSPNLPTSQPPTSNLPISQSPTSNLQPVSPSITSGLKLYRAKSIA